MAKKRDYGTGSLYVDPKRLDLASRVLNRTIRGVYRLNFAT
jgi:hypothetical protein